MVEYLTPLELPFLGMPPWTVASAELDEATELGHDVTGLRARLAALVPTGEDDQRILALHDEVPTAPVAHWPYFEASELPEVLAALSAASDAPAPVVQLEDRLRGAWYGRIVGNMAGKPVEPNWPRGDLRAYLERAGAYPLHDYVPISDDDLGHLLDAGFVGEQLMPYAAVSRGRIHGGVRDDDVDWTITNLTLLEDYGLDFSAYDLARTWQSRLPVYQVFTAERVAYQNLVREVPLHEVGAFRNGFREIIGALIRADAFAYVSPGRPRRAALLAYRDAHLSHRANGIYGEMWAAALVASAFTAHSAAESVANSLEHIPARSRLAEEIRTVVADHGEGRTWDETLDALDARHKGMNGGHTINNAGALTAAILFADGDFSATVGLAVQAGLDTDSIGATAGSWAGAFSGFDAIPDHWVRPLDGFTRSAVFGFGTTRIDDLTDRTIQLERRLR